MTKEELLDTVKSGARGDKYIWLSDIDDFFDSNVCIPKGVDRHPDADVLHGAIEGASIQELQANEWCNVAIQDGINPLSEYRIKPSEPVYEWQWVVQDKKTNEYFVPSGHHTESEITKESTLFNFNRIKETKRERTQ